MWSNRHFEHCSSYTLTVCLRKQQLMDRSDNLNYDPTQTPVDISNVLCTNPRDCPAMHCPRLSHVLALCDTHALHVHGATAWSLIGPAIPNVYSFETLPHTPLSPVSCFDATRDVRNAHRMDSIELWPRLKATNHTLLADKMCHVEPPMQQDQDLPLDP